VKVCIEISHIYLISLCQRAATAAAAAADVADDLNGFLSVVKLNFPAP
jgi:hypothetical protein